MSGTDDSATNTAAYTADTPQLLLEHHPKGPRLPTILREYDKVARQCAFEQVDYQHFSRCFPAFLLGVFLQYREVDAMRSL